ncbi:MAG: PAS domain S-box protein [Rhizobiales bacterium]|nr:PAS domain S-box protein [Hyphomicrobiales bacterium]
MNPPINAASLNQPFTGWDELRTSGPAWKIERPQATVDSYVPFFPDQNGKVYELLLANLPVMLHCMDGAGRLTSVNKRWAQSLGYSETEAVGRAFNEFLAPDSRARLVQHIYPAYFQSGICRDEILTVTRKDGSMAKVVLSMNAYRGDKGRIERSVCLLDEPLNVSQAVTVVEDQRFKGAFESAAHGMALVSPLGEITLANGAFWEFLEGTEQERAASVEDILHKDDVASFLTSVGELIKSKSPSIKQELRYVTAKGRLMHGATSVALVRNDAGEVEQIILQIVDVTDKKQATQRLQHAQKMEAIGQLTGGLAHDFNNLLTVIIGNLQLLENKLGTDEKGQRRLAEAIDAARKGSDLTRQMLAFARKQVLEPREVNINDLVKGIAPLISRSIGEAIQFKADAMAGEPKALIDPSQLESSILNLAINARDAMPKGGLLTIETQPIYLDKAYAAKYPEVTPGH